MFMSWLVWGSARASNYSKGPDGEAFIKHMRNVHLPTFCQTAQHLEPGF